MSVNEPNPREETPGIHPARILAANLSPGPWSPSITRARPYTSFPFHHISSIMIAACIGSTLARGG
ncbi:hypothetical protein vBEcoMWL3_gp167c [Escherichia phage vB_EcoM_WL-3]|nr:hypothetical protein vBEcoMWL3_gp167c [Escherichia phage vB_EcoM_WL-3]